LMVRWRSTYPASFSVWFQNRLLIEKSLFSAVSFR